MEQEFYPFTFKDVSKLHSLVGEDDMEKIIVRGASNTALASLRPMAAVLLQDVNKLQVLEKSCLEDHLIGENIKKHLLEKFFELVNLWLEENNRMGNFAKLVEAFCLTGRLNVSRALEKLILDYSLPLSNTSGDEIKDGYSLSKDFLILEERPSCINQDSALSNPVILDEVFKKLDFKDKKSFRLVSPLWKNETLSFWRRNAKINVTVPYEKGPEDVENQTGITFESLIGLLEEEKNSTTGTAEENDNYKLTKYPFHAYKLSYYNGGGVTTGHFTGEDRRFWELLSPQIQDLQMSNRMIEDNPRSLYNFCKAILLNKCQNLKTLRIPKDYMADRFSENNEDVKAWWTERNSFWQRHNKNRMARNLQKLSLEIPTDTKTVWNILYLCPSLKVLSYQTKTGNGVEALLYPAANGEIIKLEELRLQFTSSWRYGYSEQDYLPLRNYFQNLNDNKRPKHLHLLGIRLLHARETPFNFSAALGQSSASLTTLELEFNTVTDSGMDFEQDWEWFTEISPFSFPNLTVFKFYADNRYHSDDRYGHQGHPIIFDFGVLKKMPKLEKLEIKMKLDREHQRRPGTKNWIFEGDRIKFIPEGVTSDYSLEEPISCRNLREFAFSGWALNEEDITVLSNWFPHLTCLNAEVKPEHLPFLLDKWNRLEKITIQTEQLITLRQLRPIKEKKRHLRISQVITGEDQRIELMEHKERIYFSC